MGSTLFRDPQARSSALAALGTLQPRALGSLNRVDPLDSVSNYYIDFWCIVRFSLLPTPYIQAPVKITWSLNIIYISIVSYFDLPYSLIAAYTTASSVDSGIKKFIYDRIQKIEMGL